MKWMTVITVILLITLTLLSTFSYAVSFDDEKYYMKEIRKNCDNPDIIEIERRNDYVEIEYMCNGKLYELVIDRISDTIFTESEADTSRISEIMLKKINKNYPAWTVDEVSHVNINDTTLYKVELVKDGIEQNVYFTLTGKLYKAKNFLASDKWNSEILKNSNAYSTSSYNFFEPTRTIDLPDILKEILGISLKEPGQVFCVQDEIGSVFLYNIEEESIEKIYRFYEVGDFEDIIYNEGEVFVLRSDGALFSIKLSEYPKNITMQYIPIQALNIEGITYDKKTSHFL